MLILPNKRAVVLRARNPAKVTSVIPHAQLFSDPATGNTMVAVPHRLEEAKLLRNLGVPVPSPLLSYYKWPGNRVPFNAQRQTAAFLTMHHRAFVLNELGTGKTYAALVAFDYLQRQGLANKLLVIAPLSTLERTWVDEIFTFFPHLQTAVLHGSKDRRLKLLDDRSVDVYVINHDGIKVVNKELAARTDLDVVIVDEIATFRNVSSGRWKALAKIVHGTKDAPQLHRKVWGMTGTPIPNQPTDAWAQARLISPDNVPRYFSQFRDAVMRQVSQLKWVPRPTALSTVDNALQPSVRFTRDQCLDLPPVMYQTRHVQFSAQQSQMYKEMLARLHAEAVEGTITAVNEGVKLSKLLQIACGVAYGDDSVLVGTGAQSRLNVVKEIIEEAPSKVIVFAPFRAVLDLLERELRSDAMFAGKDPSIARIDGEVSKTARDKIIGDFQKAEHPRVLIAQPGTMSHGLTLTAASTIVWYGAIVSHEIFEQANGRITRPGQKHSQLIVTIEGCEAERRVYSRLRNKQATQGTLLDMVKEKGYE
jgi:SNF2 family DNA or RNA helicase